MDSFTLIKFQGNLVKKEKKNDGGREGSLMMSTLLEEWREREGEGERDERKTTCLRQEGRKGEKKFKIMRKVIQVYIIITYCSTQIIWIKKSI